VRRGPALVVAKVSQAGLTSQVGNLPESSHPLHLDIRRRLFHGSSWNTVAVAASSGSVFLSSVLLAKALERSDFGRLSLVRSTLMTIAAVAPLATGLAAMKFMAELRDQDRPRAGRILGLCLLISLGAGLLGVVGLFVGAPAIATGFLKSPDVAVLMRLAAAGVLFHILSSFFISILSGAEAYRSLAKANIGAGVVLLVVVPGAAFFLGLKAAAAALTAGAAVQSLVLLRAARMELRRRGIRLQARGLKADAGIVGSFILPAAVCGLTAMPAQWFASSFLARQSGGFAELALFTAGVSLRNLVLFLPGVIASVGAAVFNAEKGRNDETASRSAFVETLKTTAVISLLAGLPVVLLAQPLLRLFGPSFEAGTAVLRVLVISAIVEALAIVVSQVPVAAGRMWIYLVFVVVPRDVSLAGVGWALVPTYGAMGLAFAWAVAQLLALGLGAVCAVVVIQRERIRRSSGFTE